MRKIGVFIAGRVESERLPNKLLLPLGKTTLWEIACKKLSKLSVTYNKYVLCNDKKLIDIAEKFKNLNVIERDPATCKVEGPMSFIFKELANVEDDYLMFLNPCLYNLSVDTIEVALVYFNKSKYETMTSVKPFKNWLYEREGDGFIKKTLVDIRTWSTKDINKYYQAAHCFHIFNKELLFKKEVMLELVHDCFVVSPEETLDVDTEEDMEFAKWKRA